VRFATQAPRAMGGIQSIRRDQNAIRRADSKKSLQMFLIFLEVRDKVVIQIDDTRGRQSLSLKGSITV
jgi:hypothetical protein